ncbi:xylosyl- and glucuronyltransferase LARGE2s isoform X1 [Leptinotarsa decemlineata]|uniref:xylosyl- and glucuronyltransferase LARGE2s isoform X1 n=1 Tax=Leptinotarsa decemlineata TaxID=7539 RepID=UPI003D3043B2
MIIPFLVIIFIFLFINMVPKLYTSPSLPTRKKEVVHLENDIDKSYVGAGFTSKNDLKDDPCEIIHIGVVCSGYNANVYFHTLLKSIYFHRANPLHFHIITNKISENILRKLINSWNVPQVNATFYDLNRFIADIRWIPNSHYSGIHGLLKLLFPKIIPLKVTSKILVLDTDLTVMSDIYELWKLFRKFNKKQGIGIVENQSDYYLGTNTWPAIGRGFNSGVLLYNLYVLKKIDWPKLWSNLTKKDALIYGSTQLADQDIINLVLKEHPELLYEVPCVWNTQLSDHTLSYECYKDRKVKIVHWNSPKKYNVENKDGEYFRSLATGFLEYNGNLLRKKLHSCDASRGEIKNESGEFCLELRKLTSSHWRTLLYFREYKYMSVDNDITFVAQLSFDRLQMIEELVKSWSGPISLTLYVTDYELSQSITFISHSQTLQGRLNVAYHAVFKEGEYYPINTLRNIGLSNVHTPYVFLADIDFLPSKDLYDTLRQHISSMGSLIKKALIVPAFEIQKYGGQAPVDKKQLLKEMEDRSVIPFLSNIWSPGHAATNYQIWKTTSKPYKVKWKVDYEPYIVVRSDVVPYDERFVGFGWNKVSHIMELEAQNYEFIVLPDVFIVHKPHTPSYEIGRFRTSPAYRLCLQLLKEEFIHKLNKKYNCSFQYSNTSVSFPSSRRKKRNLGSHTTEATNTDYPMNVE